MTIDACALPRRASSIHPESARIPSEEGACQEDRGYSMLAARSPGCIERNRGEASAHRSR